jgi:hypothetical protein
MDPKVKRKWIAALRSGKFKQAQETLLDRETGAMCCLGVLAHIQGCDLRRLRKLGSAVPPRGYDAGLDRDTANRLAAMNDGDYCVADHREYRRRGFKAIASYIAKHL